MNLAQRWSYGFTAFALAILSLTGIVGWWVLDGLRGWWLWAHTVMAPLFICGLTLLALTLAERCRWSRTDSIPNDQRCLFGAALLLGFAAIVSILLAMTSLCGSAGQETLYNVHRYSALGLVIVALVHGVSLLFPRSRGRICNEETRKASGGMGNP